MIKKIICQFKVPQSKGGFITHTHKQQHAFISISSFFLVALGSCIIYLNTSWEADSTNLHREPNKRALFDPLQRRSFMVYRTVSYRENENENENGEWNGVIKLNEEVQPSEWLLPFGNSHSHNRYIEITNIKFGKEKVDWKKLIKTWTLKRIFCKHWNDQTVKQSTTLCQLVNHLHLFHEITFCHCDLFDWQSQCIRIKHHSVQVFK